MNDFYEISAFELRVPKYSNFLLTESKDSNLRDFVNYIKSNLIHTHMQNIEYDWEKICRNYPLDEDELDTLKEDENIMSAFSYDVFDDYLSDDEEFLNDDEVNEPFSAWIEDTVIQHIKDQIDVIDGCWIYVERLMTLKKERFENYEKYLQDHYKGSAGAYWTYAHEMGNDYAGVQTGDTVVIRGRVPISRVDWQDTKFRNITMPDEYELALQTGTLVRVDSISVNNHVVFKPTEEVYVKTW